MIEYLIEYMSDKVSVPAGDIELISKIFKAESLTKGTTLKKENSIAQKLFFINEGLIRVFHMNDGSEVTTQLVHKYNFVTSFESFVSQSHSDEIVRCITDCNVLSITKKDYDQLTKDCTTWSIFCKKVYEYVINHNQQRALDLLTLSAEQRYLKLLHDHPEIVHASPGQYIASYIGIKPESLSRIRKKLSI